MRSLAFLMAAVVLLGCGSERPERKCRVKLIGDQDLWLRHVLPDPEGGYVAIGTPRLGPRTFYRLTEGFEIEREVRLPWGDDVLRGTWRWGPNYVIGGARTLLVVDRNGAVLVERELPATADERSGIHGVVPQGATLLVLWSSPDGAFHLDQMDAELQTIRSANDIEVCCDLALHGNADKAFITASFDGGSPLQYHPVGPSLEVGEAQTMLPKDVEHLSYVTATAAGDPTIATRDADGQAMLWRFDGGSPAGGLLLPGSGSFVTIRPTDQRILVNEDPLENYYEPHPVRVWSVAPDFSEVRGPFTYASATDVAYVEETSEDSFRVLAYIHYKVSLLGHDEMWLFEGPACTEADWSLPDQLNAERARRGR